MIDLKDVWTEYQDTRSPATRERIVLDCMPLVKFVVGRFAGSVPSHCDREELIQSGVFGLLDAIERFDPGKGVKFETYAILRIRGAVIDELRSRDWVPRSRRKMARDLDAVRCELESRDGAVPTVDDLAGALGVSRPEMDEMLQEVSFVSFVSLDEEQRSTDAEGETATTLMSELLRDADSAEPSAGLELEERVRALSRAITELPEQERLTVILHYYEGMHIKDVAELYGVSESRISQIHSRALVLLKLRIEQLLNPAD